MFAVAEPWSVVRSEDDERIVFDLVFAECGDNLTDGPVDFHEYVGEESFAAAILEFIAGEERHVDHGVWQVQEERAFTAAINEGGGFFGIESCEFCLIGGGDCGIDDGVVFEEWQVWPAFQSFLHGQVQDFWVERPHIIAVWQSEVFVEAVLERQELVVMSEVPFAEAGGGIIFLPADFCECGFVGIDTDVALWSECPLNTDSHVVTAGQECGS